MPARHRSSLFRRKTVDATAQRHLFGAAVAATASRDHAGRFADLATVATAIAARVTRHGVERVEVVDDTFGAVRDLAVYLIEDESSPDALSIVVPFDGRRFLACKLRSDGEVDLEHGIAY